MNESVEGMPQSFDEELECGGDTFGIRRNRNQSTDQLLPTPKNQHWVTSYMNKIKR